MKRFFAFLILAGVVLLTGSLVARTAPPQAMPILRANPALPPVVVPPGNPQTDAKVQLGKMLYFDTRLSADNTISCATCHDPDTAWANHGATDSGIGGKRGNRNSGTILDAAYMDYQFWDGRAKSLEEQALGPIHNPVEMGETLDNVVKKLNAIPQYRTQFQAVFRTDATADAIGKAIAAFERTVLSGPSPYDRYMSGDKGAISAAAVRGMAVFNTKGHCAVCHNGPMFSNQWFHNLGLGMDQPNPDIGREAVTKDSADRGKFKTAGLRNVALTYPYMHDGSMKTLNEVVEFYNKGGVPNPNLDPAVKPLGLSGDEQADLVEFLKALTGTMPRIDRPTLPKAVTN
jgi:cytochrome c peroxidase